MSFYAPDKLTDTSSELQPEILDDLKKLKEAKRNSRILMKASELDWKVSRHSWGSASLINPRQGFRNTFANLGIAKLAAGNHSGRHKHTEAYVYIVKGKGHSMVDEKRYDWSEGDALYIPPNVFHQHFNDGNTEARLLRVTPGPLLLNFLALMATFNVSTDGMLEATEASAAYDKELKGYFG